MARKGPKPYLKGHETKDGIELTLYEAIEGAHRAVARWIEPNIESIQGSGELAQRLNEIRAKRKSQGK